MKIALICCLVVLFAFSCTRLDAAETVCKFAQKNEYRVVNAGKSENVVVNACGPAVQVATPADVAAAKVDVARQIEWNRTEKPVRKDLIYLLHSPLRLFPVSRFPPEGKGMSHAESTQPERLCAAV